MSDYSDRILSLTPKAYWRNGISYPTGTVPDLSGNGYDAALSSTGGAPGWVAGNYSQTSLISGDSDTALKFEINTFYTPTASGGDVPFTGSFSMECWIKFTAIDDADGHGIMGRFKTSGYAYLEIGLDGQIRFLLRDQTGVGIFDLYSGTTYSINTLYYIVATYNSSTGGKLYVNAVEKASSASTGAYDFSSGAFDVGRLPGSAQRYLDAIVDEVAVYDEMLTATQITDTYNLGASASGVRDEFVFVTAPAVGGDETYFDTTTDRWVRLAIGATDTIKRVVAGLPTWSTIASTLGSLLTTQGDLLTRDGSAVVRFPRPSVDSYLTHASGAANVAWSAQSLLAFLASANNFTALNSVKAGGASTQQATIGGTIYVSTTTAGNTDAGEDTLHTFSVPANTLNTTGDSLEYYSAGTFANNANNKRLRVYFGATTMLDTGIVTTALAAWELRGVILRVTSTTQKASATLVVYSAGGTVQGSYSTPGETLTSGTPVLKTTAEAVTTNDVVAEFFKLYWKPAAPA